MSTRPCLPAVIDLVDEGGRDFSVRLQVGNGDVNLRARRRQQSPVSDALFLIDAPVRAAQLWRAVATWLGVPVPACHESVAPGRAPLVIRPLTSTRREDGAVWESLELTVGPAQLVLHLSVDTGLGELAEKDPSRRAVVVQALREALGDVEGLPAVQPAPRASAPTRPAHAPFSVGDQVEHASGRGRVTAVQRMDLNGTAEVMVAVELSSGQRMWIPAAQAGGVLRAAR